MEIRHLGVRCPRTAFKTHEVPSPPCHAAFLVQHHSPSAGLTVVLHDQFKPDAPTLTGDRGVLRPGFSVLIQRDHDIHNVNPIRKGGECMMRVHRPKGPKGSWKTGQRVPETGNYADQFGVICHFEQATTFPPTSFGRKSECGYYLAVLNQKRTSSAS